MSAPVLRVLALIGALAFSSTALARAQSLPPLAYRSAAREAGVPATVLFSMALQESGMWLAGRLRPWPWTLNIAGAPYRYANREQACTSLQRALETVPPTRVDAGLGQINVGYHGHRVNHPCALLDPYRNLAITATILREQHTEGEDWLIAIGRYHRPAGGEPAARYRRSVQQHHLRTFGSISIAATSRARP